MRPFSLVNNMLYDGIFMASSRTMCKVSTLMHCKCQIRLRVGAKVHEHANNRDILPGLLARCTGWVCMNWNHCCWCLFSITACRKGSQYSMLNQVWLSMTNSSICQSFGKEEKSSSGSRLNSVHRLSIISSIG